MILGVGIDLCEAQRMEKSLQRQTFCDHVFAAEEQALLAGLPARRRAETAAANFAAKEAFLKAVGTGLGGFAVGRKLGPNSRGWRSTSALRTKKGWPAPS